MSLIPENLSPNESEAVRLDELLRWFGENGPLIAFALENLRDFESGDKREYLEQVEGELSEIVQSVKDSGYELPEKSTWEEMEAAELAAHLEKCPRCNPQE